jgi:hypothetical protein
MKIYTWLVSKPFGGWLVVAAVAILLLLWSAAGFAQTPANAVLVGAEGITITACSTTACTYQFGAGAKFNTVAGAKYPLVVSCTSAASCALLGGDPLPNVAKSIYAVQQTTAYTVTVAGKPVPIVVPALPLPPPPPVTPVKQWSCTGVVLYSLMSDGTFQVTNSGALTCRETI